MKEHDQLPNPEINLDEIKPAPILETGNYRVLHVVDSPLDGLTSHYRDCEEPHLYEAISNMRFSLDPIIEEHIYYLGNMDPDTGERPIVGELDVDELPDYL